MERPDALKGAATNGEEPASGSPGAPSPSVSAALASLKDHMRTPLFRNAYALVINTGITAILGFAYWVMAARLYSTRDVGLAAAAISAMSLLAGISLFNLEAVLVRFIPIAGRHTRKLVASVYLACGFVAMLIATLFIVGLEIWQPALGFLAEHASGVWFVVAAVAWMYFILQDGILVGLGHALWVPLENMLFGIGKLALLVYFAGTGPFGIFESWTIAAAVIVVPFTALVFLRFVPLHMMKEVSNALPLTRHELRKYATGDYVGAMFDLAAISLLPLVVTQMAGPEENAFFYQSWIIAYTLILVANNMSRSLTVEVAKDQRQLRAYGRAVFGQTLKLLTPAVAAIVLLAPLLLSVFGPEYAEGGTLTLRLLVLAAIPHTVLLLALVMARLQHRMREVIAIQAATSVIVLGAALLLAAEHGGLGAAIGWLAGQTIVAVVLLATRLQWLYRATTPDLGDGR